MPKLVGNAERDRRNLAELETSGWTPIVVWECETKDAAKLAAMAAQIREMPALTR